MNRVTSETKTVLNLEMRDDDESLSGLTQTPVIPEGTTRDSSEEDPLACILDIPVDVSPVVPDASEVAGPSQERKEGDSAEVRKYNADTEPSADSYSYTYTVIGDVRKVPGDGANTPQTFEKDVSLVSLLEKDLSKVDNDVSLLENNITKVDKDVSLVEMDVIKVDKDVSLVEMNVTKVDKDVSLPGSYPAKEVKVVQLMLRELAVPFDECQCPALATSYYRTWQFNK